MSENMENELKEFEAKLIETLDEDGNTVELELLDIIEIEGVEYAILRTVDADEEDDEELETEAVLMRLKKDGEDYTFETIDDDDEFNFVAQYIAELGDEEYEEDDEDEE